jgi:6,7-dimethyl-8-ribityllumazine synthase
MATPGNISLTKGIPQLQDAFVVIVRTEWNDAIVSRLESGCKKLLKQHGVKFKVLNVPGAVEIAFAVRAYAESKLRPADAFITLGAVIRGDTPHFDYVCKAVTDGLVSLNMILDVPTVFGVLTVENDQQAIDRVGGRHGHKGEEAAITAIKMIALNRSLRNK